MYQQECAQRQTIRPVLLHIFWKNYFVLGLLSYDISTKFVLNKEHLIILSYVIITFITGFVILTNITANVDNVCH